jgi:hypothetical protein
MPEPDYPAILRELNLRIQEHPESKLLIIQEFYAEKVKAGEGAAADYILTLRSIVMANSNEHGLPTWLERAGLYVGIGTLLFFMVIVILSITGYDVSDRGRFALLSVLALGAAFAAAAFTGRAAVSGEIPFLQNQKPLAVSATGGFAAFILVFVLGYWIYIK